MEVFGFEGGEPIARPSKGMLGTDGRIAKRIEAMQYRDLVFHYLPVPGAPVNAWLTNSLKGTNQAVSGTIIVKERLSGQGSEMQFSGGFLRQIAFPEVDVQHRRYVIDGTCLSSGGAMTAFDLTTRLIGDLFGEGLRLEVAALFMSADIERPEDPLRRLPRGRMVESAIALMRKHIEDPLPLPLVARRLGVSLRELEARFAAELGAGPKGVYRSLRLSAARRYVEQSSYPVSEIALRCGYRNASAMTRAFNAEFGVTPRDLRKG